MCVYVCIVHMLVGFCDGEEQINKCLTVKCHLRPSSSVDRGDIQFAVSFREGHV